MINAKHPFLLLSNEVAELCRPLEDFGIHHFTYLKQFSNGSRISLSNKPSWIADYYNLNLYRSSLFEKPINGAQSSFNAWFGDYNLDVYWHGKSYYNTMHSISITEFGQSCEAFLFATTPDNPQAIHYLSNNREILYHFILHLKDRGKSIFDRAEKNKILIPSSRVSNNTPKEKVDWFQDTHWLELMENKKQQFFSQTPIHRIGFENTEIPETNLTQREIMCIYHLLNHKTAKETAKLMNISIRTVESYLNNIRLKLSCDSKSELIQKFQNNPYWSAII